MILPGELFISEELLEENCLEIDFILSKMSSIYVVNQKVIDSISFLTKSSGIFAIFEKPEREIDLNGKIVYLNGINDPGNLGTILRTAIAFDFCNIVVDENCADIYNPKTVNASKDSIFKLNISYEKNLKILKKIKSKMKIYSTLVSGGINPKNIKDNKYCIVFGNEANGISEQVKRESDVFVTIPINKIESLNVAISAGIILYELK